MDHHSCSTNQKRTHDDAELDNHPDPTKLGKRLRLTVKPLYSKGLRDGGKVDIGNGNLSATIRELRHEEKKASFFFSGPIKQVKHDPDHQEKAAGLNLVKESVVVSTADGKPMVIFLKGVMFSETVTQSDKLHGLEDLAKVCALEVPNDPRHREKEKKRWDKKGLPYGVLHLAYWHEQCHVYDKPIISRDARPDSEVGKEAIRRYMEATAQEHEMASQWLKIVDPTWQTYHKSCQGLKEELGHLYQGPQACWSSLALIVNLTVDPHKDKGDVKDGWVSTTCFGDFEGAHPVFPELHLRLDMKPGDLVLAKSAVAEHFLTPIVSGERGCHTRFTKANILCPNVKVFDCPIEGCSRGYQVKQSLRVHLLKKTGENHGLNKSEVKKLVAEVKSSVDELGEDQ